MLFVQAFIHKLEAGGGMRLIRAGLVGLTLLAIPLLYNWRAFRNLASQEAMDEAQLARNIARGKGYSTLFIRPFSIYLLKKRAQEKQMPGEDAGRLKGMHPDLANPPLYPLALAALMKVVPFDYTIPARPKGFWGNNNRFWRYKPDFFIAVFNQLLFFTVIALVFLLARRLFDAAVAWLSAVLLLGTELFWRFTVSGLSTMLLLLIFTGLVWCLVLLEREAREPERRQVSLLGLAVLVGILVGLGGLTRYAFGWLIIPVLIFLVLFSGPQRILVALVALVAFAAVMAPWLARNYNLSGAPFGTAGFSVLETTFLFPENRLQRSLEPDLNRYQHLTIFWVKLVVNARQILQNDVPRLGGSWVSAFFLVGLLVGFRNPALRRLRIFLLLSLVVLGVVQALGRTQLSEESPDLNSENLLVLLAPFVLVYGVSLFFLLLDQIELQVLELRYLVTGLFGVVACLPLIFTFLPPATEPVVYPPYFPPVIQTVGSWLKEEELTMSDVPWAMAWYGQRQ